MRARVYVTVALWALVVPAVAAAALPSASTGGARNITQTSALLKGTINPNSQPTTWYFQYGTTKAYGSQTQSQGPTGSTKGTIPVSATIQGLTPATTYHFRLAAVNASGTKLGRDKTFKTLKTPPSITLGAAPARLVFGGSTTLAGQFTPSPGAPVAGVKVTLQQDQAPFNVDFKAVATTKTDAAGHFSFAQMPALNTTYRVVAASSPRATSLSVVVPVAFRVTVSLSTSHPRRGKKVVFSGTVGPAHNGGLVRIQKRVRGGWRTVKTAILGPSPGSLLSAYRAGVRIRSGGVYRVFVPGDSQNVGGVSRHRRIRPR